MKTIQVKIAAAAFGLSISWLAIGQVASRPSFSDISVKTVYAADRSAACATQGPSCNAASAGTAPQNSASQILEQAFAAIGSGEAIAAVNSTRFKGTSTTTRPSGTVMLHVERITVFPANFYVAFQDSRNTITKIVDTPNFSQQTSGQSTTAIPPAQLADLRLAVKLDPIYVAKYRNDFSCSEVGNEKIGNVNTVKLKISGQGAEALWNIDPASGRLLRATYATTASGQVVAIYSDWRSVGGIQVAYKRHTETSKETTDVVVDKYEVNPTVDPKIFAAPAH